MLIAIYRYIIGTNPCILATGAVVVESCELEPRSWRGALDTTLRDNFVNDFTGRWFSPVMHVSSTI